jgi:hypothetical protein
MADVTPSPAADGPFSLVTDETKEALVPKPRTTNPLIAQLLSEGKTPDEIMRAVYEAQLAADSAGAAPHV